MPRYCAIFYVIKNTFVVALYLLLPSWDHLLAMTRVTGSLLLLVLQKSRSTLHFGAGMILSCSSVWFACCSLFLKTSSVGHMLSEQGDRFQEEKQSKHTSNCKCSEVMTITLNLLILIMMITGIRLHVIWNWQYTQQFFFRDRNFLQNSSLVSVIVCLYFPLFK